LGLIELIDAELTKRQKGLSVGQYLVLAAINRARDGVRWRCGYPVARLPKDSDRPAAVQPNDCPVQKRPVQVFTL